MIVFIVHALGVLPLEAKGDAPISTDIYSPRIGSTSFQFVEPQAGKIHVLRLTGSIEPTEYETESIHMMRCDSGDTSRFEETPEAPMLETPNHPT